MFLSVHSPTGALIGGLTGSPLLAFLGGLLSHFLLDRIPHWDPPTAPGFEGKKIVFDTIAIRYIIIVLVDSLLVLLFTLFVTIKFTFSASTLLGIIGSVTPDYIMGVYILTKTPLLKPFQDFHNFMHYDPKKIQVPFGWGNLVQVTTFSLGIFLYLIFN